MVECSFTNDAVVGLNPVGLTYWNRVRKIKRKYGCDGLSVELTLLGLPHIVKVASEMNMEMNFTSLMIFSIKALLRYWHFVKRECRPLKQ